MEKLSAMTDEDLVRDYKENENQAAANLLYERYKDTVKYKAKTMFIAGGDKEDLIQEGMIGLFNAVRDYDVERSVKFTTFANICIERQIQNAIKASNRQKNLPLNGYISLDQPLGQGDDEELTIGDNLAADDFYNPEYAYLSKEEISTINADARTKLSAFEREVFALSKKGQNYQQIAKALKKTPKSIDNALTRIKKKLSAK